MLHSSRQDLCQPWVFLSLLILLILAACRTCVTYSIKLICFACHESPCHSVGRAALYHTIRPVCKRPPVNRDSDCFFVGPRSWPGCNSQGKKVREKWGFLKAREMSGEVTLKGHYHSYLFIYYYHSQWNCFVVSEKGGNFFHLHGRQPWITLILLVTWAPHL